VSYLYVKKTLTPPTPAKHHKSRHFFAFSLFGLGIFLLLSAVFPIVQFQLEYSTKFNQVINPLSPRFYDHSNSVLGELSTDYTQLSNWFIVNTKAPSETPNSSASSTAYTLSIPKLKIDNADVIVGSSDLKKSLIQYPQTALPGQLGNSVIFGHSVLPQFFNPKSYLTIFSTLYHLKQGDEVYVNYDNIRYKYLIEEMYEVSPNDLSVLEQRFDGRYLTLITCSPPGTYLRRLIIKSRIVDI
jgi:sortase A